MKVQLETLTSSGNRSFSMMFNPRLSDLFFWHNHPEYELVYIQAQRGTRHVGQHMSQYTQSDLVLIGSNLPHLNFDYGVKTDYKKVVVHLSKSFVEEHFKDVTELNGIDLLFQKAKFGLSFDKMYHASIGEKLFDLEGKSRIEQYLSLIKIFHDLSHIQEISLLNQQAFFSGNMHKEQERIRAIYAFVDKNYQRKIDLDEVAAIACMSKEAFCRSFKKSTQNTFTTFLNGYRISHAKRHLMNGQSVGEACYSSGFESLSYFNRVFKKITSQNPSEFRKNHL